MVHHWTYDGWALRMLNVLDEFTRESLAIRVRRKLSSIDIIDVLTDPFILRRAPGHIRSDNGPEFVAGAVRPWIAAVGARTAVIEPGLPRENSYIESYNARLRDELLDGKIFYRGIIVNSPNPPAQRHRPICRNASSALAIAARPTLM